jgi:hypothetical protein
MFFSDHLLSTVIQPTIADLQREIANAGPDGRQRLRARWRGYCAFWKVMLVAPFATSSSTIQDVTAVGFRRALARPAAVAIAITLLIAATPPLRAWVAVAAAVGTAFALLMHVWYDRHPSRMPMASEPLRRSPQINFSSTEVAGNIGGLIFVVGSVFIVVIGLPSVIWFLLAATFTGGCLAWALVTWHTSHPKSGLPENLIVLR